MSSTLYSEPVVSTLERLRAAEGRQNMAEAFAEAGVDVTADFPLDLSPAELAERAKDIIMPVSGEAGDLLYLFARAAGARTVVEFGASFGVSALYLASAVRDNGGGRVITTELQRDKARLANENFAAAGLDDIVELRVGDALETLADLPDEVDLLHLDGWPTLRLPVLDLVQPRLRPGSLVVVDDIDLDVGRDINKDFLDHVDDPASGYLSLRLPVHQGVQACLRLG